MRKNASEVESEALRMSLNTESENERLKRAAAIGYAQLKAEDVVSVCSKKQFMALARRGA